MTKQSAWLLITLIFAMTQSPAMALDWQNANVFKIGNLIVHRPDDTWRVTEEQKYRGKAVSLQRFQHGTNLTIYIYAKEAFHKRTKQSYKLNDKYWQKKFKEATTDYYHKLGFTFFEYKINDQSISAKASDPFDRLLLVHMVFEKPNYSGKYYILETELPRKNFVSHHDYFDQIVKNIHLNYFSRL